MELEFWASTDVGRVRDHNEDNFLVDKRMNLFVVCDGMGGHAAGEVASAVSVRVVREVISNHREVFDRLEADPENRANRKSVLALLEHAIQEACSRIYHQAQEDSSKRGMGTTCSVLLLAEGHGFIGHVGDSRIYLYRGEQVHQITEDHSLVNEMLRLGKIQPGEEDTIPHKNAVTRAVGVNEFVEVDTFELDVQAGDAFLLCSDGLSGYFKNDGQIVELMATDDPKTVTEKAIQFANAGGGKDNITAILIRVTSDDSQKRDIQRTMEILKSAPYFQYLAYKEMVQVVNLSKRVEYRAGERVFAEGEDPAAMFILSSGTIRLDREGRTIGTLLPGDHFAEAAIIDQSPQGFGATAIDDTVVLAFHRDRFMELLRAEPNLAVKLLWNFLQTFAFRMRGAPYEAFLGERAQGLDENTPPSGTLVFQEDRRSDGHQPASVSGEFIVPDVGAANSSGEHAAAKPQATPRTSTPAGGTARPGAAAGQQSARSGAARPPKPHGARPSRDAVSADLKITQDSKLDPDATVDDRGIAERNIKDTIPAGMFGVEDLKLPPVSPENLDEDLASLRETMQMDQEVDDRARTHEALKARASKPAADASKAVSAPGGRPSIGKAISGESVVRTTTPQSGVVKRAKLSIQGGEASSDETHDIPSLKTRQREADTTLELDLADDNIEEVN